MHERGKAWGEHLRGRETETEREKKSEGERHLVERGERERMGCLNGIFYAWDINYINAILNVETSICHHIHKMTYKHILLLRYSEIKKQNKTNFS